MSWSYDPSLTTALDRVRLTIGDTRSGDQQLQNEELEALLTQYGGDEHATAQAAARKLAARYARQADKWVGDLKILNSQKSRAYAKMAEEIVASATSRGIPSAGGISQTKKEAAEEDADRVVPFFRRGMHDNEG